MFRFAYENDIIDSPMKYGRGFCRPSASTKRRAQLKSRTENGKKLLAATGVRRLLTEAGIQLRATILLGVNGGSGNTDCACLSPDAVDLKHDVIGFYRFELRSTASTNAHSWTSVAATNSRIPRPVRLHGNSAGPLPARWTESSGGPGGLGRVVLALQAHGDLHELDPSAMSTLGRPHGVYTLPGGTIRLTSRRGDLPPAAVLPTRCLSTSIRSFNGPCLTRTPSASADSGSVALCSMVSCRFSA